MLTICSCNSWSRDSLIFTQGTMHKNSDEQTFRTDEKRFANFATPGMNVWDSYITPRARRYVAYHHGESDRQQQLHQNTLHVQSHRDVAALKQQRNSDWRSEHPDKTCTHRKEES